MSTGLRYTGFSKASFSRTSILPTSKSYTDAELSD
jgi:hypothetical protein